MVRTAVIGAAGFSGQETLDRVLAHPELELVAVGSQTLGGRPISALDPRLGRNGNGALPGFVTNGEALEAGAELVFCCLDHEAAAELEPPADAVVVDLSGAHRLPADAYPEWYGFEHPGGNDAWCYALPELAPPVGRLIANPGCYATAALLAIGPIAGAISQSCVIVDAKSGVSGAGRTLKPASHAAAVLDNITPYRVGKHQHEPEIEQLLCFPVCFVPHLVPLRRGLIATCYVQSQEDIRPLLESAYADSLVVSVLPEDVSIDLSRVQNTDAAEIAVFQDRPTGRWIVICAIDNLGKGAAGQAVQNANLALGLDETAGLPVVGVYP
jgi:N-acetyl-gamma-glutamyl-phosphate reductase